MVKTSDFESENSGSSPDEAAKPLRPFGENEYLSSSDLETLQEWLEENCDQTLHLTADYTVADLVADIGGMLGGMWSDGIDAMGEDA